MAVSYNVKHTSIIWHSNFVPMYLPKRSECLVYTKMWTCQNSLILNSPQLERTQMSWHSRTTEHWSTVKRNEILIYAATWMNLKNFMLNEKDYMLSDSIYGKFYKRQSWSDGRSIGFIFQFSLRNTSRIHTWFLSPGPYLPYNSNATTTTILWGGSIITPLSQIRKLRPRKVKELVQSHATWQ